MTDGVERATLARIADEIRAEEGRRFVVGIAGPPATGKSTLASALAEHLGSRVALLGLDAYHFDNRILLERGHRDRRGAPHTFDVAAFALMLGALRDKTDGEISIPVFDRAAELSRNCASVVSRDHDVVVTEGNYLLLDEPPWSGLARLFDLTVWVDAPISLLETRIRQRWLDHGLSPAEAQARWEHNDRPNAELVISSSRQADVTVLANHA